MLETDTPTSEDLGTEKRIALAYMAEAFAEAEMDGLDSEVVIQAALFQAFRQLVDTYGEEETAKYAATFADKIRSGHFSVASRH